MECSHLIYLYGSVIVGQKNKCKSNSESIKWVTKEIFVQLNVSRCNYVLCVNLEMLNVLHRGMLLYTRHWQIYWSKSIAQCTMLQN